MEDIILESHLPHISPSKTQAEYNLRVSAIPHLDGVRHKPLAVPAESQAVSARKRIRPKDFNASWGRSGSGTSLLTTTACAGILVLCPLLVVFLWTALQNFDGSLFASIATFWSEGPMTFAARFAPTFSINACFGYAAWLSFQSTLYTNLPSQISTGQLTPAGNILKYKTNGLSAWIITHALGIGAVMAGVLDPAILAKNWGGLLIAANIYGFLVSAFSYMKAYVAPTHPQDRKFSGQQYQLPKLEQMID